MKAEEGPQRRQVGAIKASDSEWKSSKELIESRLVVEWVPRTETVLWVADVWSVSSVGTTKFSRESARYWRRRLRRSFAEIPVGVALLSAPDYSF